MVFFPDSNSNSVVAAYKRIPEKSSSSSSSKTKTNGAVAAEESEDEKAAEKEDGHKRDEEEEEEEREGGYDGGDNTGENVTETFQVLDAPHEREITDIQTFMDSRTGCHYVIAVSENMITIHRRRVVLQ